MTKSQQGGFKLFGLGENTSGYGYGYAYGMPNYTMESGINSGVVQYLYYFITFFIIVLFVLIIVHFTIRPIFITKPGQQGIIPLPGGDDSRLFWKDPKILTVIPSKSSPLGSNYQNWSFLLDFQVDNPTANTGRPRVLFTRGAASLNPTTFGENDTILQIVPDFNVCVYLDKLTNDLHVTVLTTIQGSKSPQTIIVPNIPVRKAVRLGCMVGDKVMEVYINGKLYKSITYTYPLVAQTGSLRPPSNTLLSNTVQVGNLRIWNRPISPSEFRSYGSANDFDIKEIPDSCIS